MPKKHNNKVLTAISCLLFAVIVFHSNCSTSYKPKVFPDNLIWPSPPDIPRIKFIASIASEEDVAGIKKKSLKDILTGENPREKIQRLRRPHGVCTDSNGRIYVVDSGTARVFVFDRSKKEVLFIGNSGRGRLSWPLAVMVDEEDTVFVSDVRLQNVLVYSSDGTFQKTLGEKGDFINPTGIAYEKQKKRILIADSKAHDIKVYSQNGEFVLKFGKRGVSEGEFNFPTNIAIGKDGYIYVVDTGNHRVQVFDEDYEYYDDFGSLGRRPGQFRRPKGIALDSEDHIYVVDSDFNNFQIFNQDYQILMPVGSFGRDYGQFRLPAGIHIDAEDFIYVVDSYNARVQIFQYLKEKASGQ